MWNKFWRDKSGKIVIVQRPNFWLIGWMVAAVVSLLVPRGTAQHVAYYISDAFLIVWAGLELVKGVNYFRRLLGLVVLLLTVAGLLGIGK